MPLLHWFDVITTATTQSQPRPATLIGNAHIPPRIQITIIIHFIPYADAPFHPIPNRISFRSIMMVSNAVIMFNFMENYQTKRARRKKKKDRVMCLKPLTIISPMHPNKTNVFYNIHCYRTSASARMASRFFSLFSFSVIQRLFKFE